MHIYIMNDMIIEICSIVDMVIVEITPKIV